MRSFWIYRSMAAVILLFHCIAGGVFCIMGLSMKERLRVWRDGWEEKDNLGLEH
jgi:hypothetical protein